MFQIFRRIGFFGRRWILALVLIGAFVLAGYWMVPWRGAGADLQLVALRPDGSFARTVRGLPAPATDDSIAPRPSDRRGIPLVLAIANSGVRPGSPERLVISLPRWYRLTSDAGTVRNELIPDEALQRYVIELDAPQIQGGRVPTLLPGVDTLWLEPFVPDYWCTADVDSVPQLIPSTPPDSSGVIELPLFWSFEGRDLTDRQTGLLTVQMPGELFERSGAVDFTQSPVNLELPTALRPAMGLLVEGGTRYADCGPPGDPMRIFSALWITPSGGRMVSIHYGGMPRKEYYDLNRDSVFELEMWDPDGDGEMEAWRTLSLPIPDYMLPEDPILVADSAAAAAAARDSAAAAALAAAATGDTSAATMPSLGGAMDIATLSRLWFPGDITRARRLFAPPPPPRAPVVRDDGPIGVPLGAPQRAEPEPPARVETPEPAQPETPEPEPVPEVSEPEEPEPDLIDRVLQEAAEQEQNEQPED